MFCPLKSSAIHIAYCTVSLGYLLCLKIELKFGILRLFLVNYVKYKEKDLRLMFYGNIIFGF